MKPTVSIVIPFYNKAGYIGETMCSVIEQTEKNWELLVVDNGSTDAGPEIVRATNDARIKLLSSPKLGASSARNYGYEHATGKWVVFLDADDLLDPEYLRSQLNHSSHADIVLCPYVEFDDGASESQRIKALWQNEPSQRKVVDSAIIFAPGPTHAFLVRRAFLRSDLLWPEHRDRLLGEDTIFWFRLLNEGRLNFNEQPVAQYRFGTVGGRFSTLSKPFDLYAGMTDVVNENLHYLTERGEVPTFMQAENLMRFYAGVYFQARRQYDGQTADKALHSARRWQSQYFQTCPRPTLPMKMRRWLGLPIFTRIVGHA